MKKFKKIAALLLAMVMALAMAVPAMAAASSEDPYNATITVNGLTDGVTTTLKYYQVVRYDKETQAWAVADWATDYVTDTTNPYEIDWAALEKVVSDDNIYKTETEEGTTHTITVPVGAYMIIATDSATTYTVMGAQTYDKDKTYLTSKDATVDAKTAGYNVDKDASDNFVAKGEEVIFTITTTFPTFDSFAEGGSEYVITDTVVSGLDLEEITSVTVGGVEVKSSVATNIADDKQSATVTWSGITNNENAGKIVVVTIKATVTSDEGYDNTANAKRDNAVIGSDDEKGYSGDIILTKYAADGTTVLNGAEFEVYKDGSTTPLSFVKVSDGVYKLAGGDAEGTETTTTIVATNGTVKISGLDEGTYSFKETKAPAGYSINTTNTEVTITADESKNVSMTGSMNDTKLSSLPSTGGIGTTIFTIAGCMIMIAAGGMLIVSRRRKNA